MCLREFGDNWCYRYNLGRLHIQQSEENYTGYELYLHQKRGELKVDKPSKYPVRTITGSSLRRLPGREQETPGYTTRCEIK